MHYSKREMGRDQIQVMNTLGFKQFQAVGHDRGGRVLFQMMLDHPYSVEKAVVLDIAPTTEMYAHTDQEFATKYFWWFFHIQPSPIPEYMSLSEKSKSYRGSLIKIKTSRDFPPW
ncbi:alpha/beta fold hydrolase [Paenibacillus albiflavus]|uniref:alpha/beta fold hydrolase n=1 Tax=Paenibacillus albiflavus TaxID=2545760 RepID=UPI0038B2DCF5